MTVLGDIPILAAIPNFDNFINEKSSGKTEQ
jgi:hypothetical protein